MGDTCPDTSVLATVLNPRLKRRALRNLSGIELTAFEFRKISEVGSADAVHRSTSRASTRHEGNGKAEPDLAADGRYLAAGLHGLLRG